MHILKIVFGEGFGKDAKHFGLFKFGDVKSCNIVLAPQKKWVYIFAINLLSLTRKNSYPSVLSFI